MQPLLFLQLEPAFASAKLLINDLILTQEPADPLHYSSDGVCASPVSPWLEISALSLSL